MLALLKMVGGTRTIGDVLSPGALALFAERVAEAGADLYPVTVDRATLISRMQGAGWNLPFGTTKTMTFTRDGQQVEWGGFNQPGKFEYVAGLGENNHTVVLDVMLSDGELLFDEQASDPRKELFATAMGLTKPPLPIVSLGEELVTGPELPWQSRDAYLRRCRAAEVHGMIRAVLVEWRRDEAALMAEKGSVTEPQVPWVHKHKPGTIQASALLEAQQRFTALYGTFLS